MKPVVVDLLDDSSDEENDVKVVGTTVKKENKAESSTKLGSATTPAAAAAMKRALQNDSVSPYPDSKQPSSNLYNLSVRELKSRLTKHGISFRGCVEKRDLVERLEKAPAGAVKSENVASSSSSRNRRMTSSFSNVSRDPYGPLKDGESTNSENGKYKIKRTGQVYYCTCPSWKWQRTPPGDGRTCKHIDALRAGFGWNHVGHSFPSNMGGSKKRAATTKSATSSSKKAKVVSSNDEKIEVTLADTYKPDKHDPTGYYLSEKLDGTRCVWDGKGTLWSRNGKAISTPTWFTTALPQDFCLDGELFLGRGTFQELMSIKSNPQDPRWNQVKLVVFDAPKANGDFPTRLRAIENALAHAKCPKRIAYLLEQTTCRGKDHMEQVLVQLIQQKGEGIMLRNPKAPYESGRTKNLLKYKKWHDAEARVIGYTEGTGKHKGRLGALKCAMILSGKEFKLGTGFKDAERQNHLYPIGSTITYSYQELTNDGVPRFPKYLRQRPQE